MTNPTSGWDKVPITGTYKNIDGTAKQGKVVFTINERIVAVDGSAIYPAGSTLTGTLNESGSLTGVQMPATDDPDISPTGWSVRVEEKLTDGSGRAYYIEPKLTMLPGGLNLARVVLPPTGPGTPASALVKGVPGGVAALDENGNVIDAYGNPITGGGGGGGAGSHLTITDNGNGTVSLIPDDSPYAPLVADNGDGTVSIAL